MDDRRALRGWGGTSPSVSLVHPAGDDDDLARMVTDTGGRGVLARGLGRSYGDAAQNGGGVVADMTTRNRVLSVDTRTGGVSVESGVSLDALMRLLLPMGLFVPVSPGTRQVTVGGAVATGEYASSSEVIRDALRDWTHKRSLRQQGVDLAQHVRSLRLRVRRGVVRHLPGQINRHVVHDGTGQPWFRRDAGDTGLLCHGVISCKGLEQVSRLSRQRGSARGGRAAGLC